MSRYDCLSIRWNVRKGGGSDDLSATVPSGMSEKRIFCAVMRAQIYTLRDDIVMVECCGGVSVRFASWRKSAGTVSSGGVRATDWSTVTGRVARWF